MNNDEMLNALAQMLLNRNNCITMEMAYNNFINHAKSRCRKETIIYYEKKWNVLKTILNTLNARTTNDITKSLYNQIVNILINRNYSNVTINKYTDVLKSIMKINVELDYINYSPIANIKKLKETLPEIKTIKQSNINMIFEYLFSLKPNFINIRDTLAILLMNDTGIRINELINIKLKNVNVNNNTIYLDYTKTHESRYIFFSDLTKEYLLKYLYYHNDNDYLFINLTGEKMKRDSIYNTLEQIKKRLNIEQSITPHKWRHTFATRLIKNNVNLNTIMRVMGHTEYSTTKRYLHQEIEDIKIQILNIIEK